MDLAEWLRQQYDTDEKVVRAATPGPWEAVENYPDSYVVNAKAVNVANESGYGDIRTEDAVHIARHDPTFVLADLASKRAILALHPTTVSKGYQVTDGWFTPEPYCECQAEDGVIYDQEPCETKRLLALPYAKREGYRQEWRPQG